VVGTLPVWTKSAKGITLRGAHLFLNEAKSSKKFVVLCVDDEADIVFPRAQLLERFGYAVIASTHPLLALDIVSDQTIDAALLDYHMPQMNGAELSARIRKKAPKVKIIMLSGCFDIPEADLACVDSFLPKCEDINQLLEVLSNLKTLDGLRRAEQRAPKAG
jgi:CheY-like chemotaxis protein